MKDSLSFPLLIATVFAGALLAVFDPANRTPTPSVAQTQVAPVAPTSPAQPATTVAEL
ncbi:MAG: hypothetical protein QM715_11595 [Nibricoccus sp.]